MQNEEEATCREFINLIHKFYWHLSTSLILNIYDPDIHKHISLYLLPLFYECYCIRSDYNPKLIVLALAVINILFSVGTMAFGCILTFKDPTDPVFYKRYESTTIMYCRLLFKAQTENATEPVYIVIGLWQSLRSTARNATDASRTLIIIVDSWIFASEAGITEYSYICWLSLF